MNYVMHKPLDRSKRIVNIVHRLNRLGISIMLSADDKLIVRPSNRLTPKLRLDIADNRDCLVKLLLLKRYVGWSKVAGERWKPVAVHKQANECFWRTQDWQMCYQHSENVILPEGIKP